MSTFLKYRTVIIVVITSVLGVLTALNVDVSAVTGVVTEVFCPAPVPAPVTAPDAGVVQ